MEKQCSSFSEILVQRMVDRYKCTESSARTKVENKSVQMVLDVLIDGNGDINKDIIEELKKQEEELNARSDELLKDRAAFEAKVSEFQDEKARFNDLHKKFIEAETEETRDKIRLFEVFNSLAYRDQRAMSYDTYIRGAVAILTGATM